MRRYDDAISKLGEHVHKGASRADRMRALTRVYWECFGSDNPADPRELERGRGVSWCGFYDGVLDGQGTPSELVLICREPKPACSPIGLHGMCGRGWLERRAFVVRDVSVLGANYVACDPRDRSELVVPVFDRSGVRDTTPEVVCVGVFDVDSYHPGAFSVEDARGAISMLIAAGLAQEQGAAPAVL